MAKHTTKIDKEPICVVVPPSSRISTSPASTPTTSQPAANNSRGLELQGNIYTEKKPAEPLSHWDQVRLVQAAMNTNHRRNFETWASDDLGMLLSPYKDGYSLNTYLRFFRDLLLFISKPKIADKFEQTVEHGHQIITALSDFFLELDSQYGYEEFAVYHSLSYFLSDDKLEFLGQAKQYLTGEDLAQVLAANGETDEETEQVQPQSSLFERMNQATIEHDRAWAKQLDEGPHESKYFKTEKELIAALDRFYPGHRWPTDKAAIVSNRRMVENLDRMEEDRVKILSETPEEKKNRLVTDAVRTVLNLPRVGLCSTAPTPTKKPASKPTTTKKKA